MHHINRKNSKLCMISFLRKPRLFGNFPTIHAGFERKDDYPPKRYLEEAIKYG